MKKTLAKAFRGTIKFATSKAMIGFLVIFASIELFGNPEMLSLENLMQVLMVGIGGAFIAKDNE